MSYRHFTRPVSTGWNTGDWTRWAIEQGLLLDVRTDVPEGVCAGCYGGTAKTFEATEIVRLPSGLSTIRSELRRWPTCYPCGHFDGLDGILPISYSLDDRLESAIYWAKNDAGYRWLNVPLASILNGFLRRHLSCVEERWGRVDVITVVPSHAGTRGGWDHMSHMISRVRDWPAAERWNLRLLDKMNDSPASTRRQGAPVDGLFRVAPDVGSVKGQRVLLIDDTYTTGASLRSAGKAIADAGGHPVAVTIGRQVRNDGFGSHIVADALGRPVPFDMSRCAIHP